MTANQEYFDSAIRHQVGVRRFAAGEVKEILLLLEAADRDLVEKLRLQIANLRGSTNTTSRRFKQLIRDVRVARREAMLELRRQFRPDLLEFAKTEVDFEQRLLQAAIPVDVSFAAVDFRQLRAAALTQPFQGKPLGGWFQSLEASDRVRLEQAVRMGVAQGESVPAVMRRVAGTASRNFSNGTLAQTRAQTEAVVRTGINHVTNSAREMVWEDNSDLVEAVRWTATLDGRTSGICRARDGKYAPVGSKPLPPGLPQLHPAGARPPAHVSCRSVMVAKLDGAGILGSRPTVADTRLPAHRELDFRKEARRTGKPVRQIRKEWTDANIGQVPATTTYGPWLRRQPAAFQDEVLGSKAKGKLFRQGGLKVEQYVDAQGNELSLRALREAVVQSGI